MGTMVEPPSRRLGLTAPMNVEVRNGTGYRTIGRITSVDDHQFFVDRQAGTVELPTDLAVPCQYVERVRPGVCTLSLDLPTLEGLSKRWQVEATEAKEAETLPVQGVTVDAVEQLGRDVMAAPSVAPSTSEEARQHRQQAEIIELVNQQTFNLIRRLRAERQKALTEFGEVTLEEQELIREIEKIGMAALKKSVRKALDQEQDEENIS